MPTPSGQISLDDVNTELDIAPGTQINMDAADVRALAEVPTGAISMSDLQNKSNAQFIVATGGTITTDGDFKVHTFNDSGTFVVNQAGNDAGSNSVDYLVLAGGGGGGQTLGAGGGAGGQLSSFPSPAIGGLPVTTTSYPVSVGAGGAKPSPGVNPGGNGSPSNFSTVNSTGGGGGAKTGFPGNPGGSGGGAGALPNFAQPGGSGNSPAKSAPATPVQGFPGGPNVLPSNTNRAGGGGGSSAAGTFGGTGSPSPQGAPGGAGRSDSITGSSVQRGGGGGAASINAQQVHLLGRGGAGGGGEGCISSNQYRSSTNGGANQGGGGGGGNAPSDADGIGGKLGGKGVVIIRYKFQ